MLKHHLSFNNPEMMYRTDMLMKAASNRYKIVVQVAQRAKRHRYEDRDSLDTPMMKPVLRALLEMSDELNAPEIIVDKDDLKSGGYLANRN